MGAVSERNIDLLKGISRKMQFEGGELIRQFLNIGMPIGTKSDDIAINFEFDL